MAELASTSIFIDKYHPSKDGTCAISIKVTYQRRKRYYATQFKFTLSDFARVMAEKPRNEFKEARIKLNHLEGRASDIIRTLPLFTWQNFEKQFLRNKGNSNTLDYAFEDYISQLKSESRVGSAVTYECARNSILSFRPKATFSDVTPDFLRKYEDWMLAEGNSITTVGIYLRSLRALVNNAIADGILSKELYPFGKRKYEIPSSNNFKKALALNDIGLIYNYLPLEGSSAEKAKDYWMFMYFCNGINVKDMCLLKYKNIQGDVLAFERAKTTRTKRKVEPIRVSLIDEAKAIIDKWGRQPVSPDEYIFPVLTAGETPERQQLQIKLLTKFINTHMKNIGMDLELKSGTTTYAARHSFATVLKRSGASTEFISEALGHTNLRTTQSYLASFEDEHKKEVVKALTAFKSISSK